MAKIDLGRVVGKSAYEIACDNGFVGTEQEWLESLDGSNYDDTELKQLINETKDLIQPTVNNAISEIIANAPEDLNTLKEIADWIDTHEDSASAMNTAIQENKNALNTEIVKDIETKIDRMFIDYRLSQNAQALRICFVSKTESNITYKNTTFNCYDSISTAIDTEYALINSSYQLGLLCVVLEGVYYEKIRLNGKTNVSIIGINKNNCIIENIDNGEENSYYYPPLWINPSTTIGNLSIRCLKKNDNATTAYCIHTDDNGVGRVLIKNCDLYCEQHACIGFGTRENAPLFIEDCTMISLNKCLYGHNSCGLQITGTVHEELHISNCYARSGSNKCIDIFDANNFYPPAGSRPKNLDWLVYMSDNIFLNNNAEDSYPTTLHISPYYEEATDKTNYFSKNIRRMPNNKGNNSPFFNYVSYYDDSELKALIENKVDKENGKVLSDNNFTDEEKEKLARLDEGVVSTLPTDSVLHYSFDKLLNDTIIIDNSGNSNHATTTKTLTKGINGKALDCVKGSQPTSCQNVIKNKNTNFSFAVWVKATEIGGYGIIGSRTGTWSNGWGLTDGAIFYLTKNQLQYNASVQIPKDNDFHLIVGVYDDTTMTSYLDGQKSNERTITLFEGEQDDSNIYLGAIFGGLGSTFNGSLDDFQVFDRPLSDSEVMGLYLAKGNTPKNYIETSAMATADKDGNDITTTYATKAELSGKSDTSHTHSDYATKDDILNHTHNDTYYTETEIDNLLKNKSDTSHTHSDYASKTDLNNKVDKVYGKQLSTNDFTNTDKSNLDRLTSTVSSLQSTIRTLQDKIDNLEDRISDIEWQIR